MVKEVIMKAGKINKRKIFQKRLKITLLSIVLLLIFSFVILSVIYNGGRFTISLDSSFSLESGIVLYEDPNYKQATTKLFAKEIDFMDNISINWLPNNINEHLGGAHNGDNYIAYTFYIENTGNRTVDYWYSITVDRVIHNIDEAVRFMVFLNNEKTVYAKINSETNEAEVGTKPFYSNDLAINEERSRFKPNDIDKFTIVVWIEGDDPDCVDALIGGEIKMHMDIREEHIEEEENKK